MCCDKPAGKTNLCPRPRPPPPKKKHIEPENHPFEKGTPPEPNTPFWVSKCWFSSLYRMPCHLPVWEAGNHRSIVAANTSAEAPENRNSTGRGERWRSKHPKIAIFRPGKFQQNAKLMGLRNFRLRVEFQATSWGVFSTSPWKVLVLLDRRSARFDKIDIAKSIDS